MEFSGTYQGLNSSRLFTYRENLITESIKLENAHSTNAPSQQGARLPRPPFRWGSILHRELLPLTVRHLLLLLPASIVIPAMPITDFTEIFFYYFTLDPEQSTELKEVLCLFA